ncbi:MAG: Rqc2 family fibronectin-binding protein [Armatimonadota bacterium]
MTFDSVVLAAVAAELNRTLTGGKVQSIHQPVPLDVVIAIRNNSTNYNLLISADAQSPRIHLTFTKRPNPKTPPNFSMLMRKYLEGARFTGAEQVGLERILLLRFAAYDGERFTLVAEIMGKHSNIVMINDAEKILGVVKPVGRSKNRYREILTGRQYVAPPGQNKVDPFTVTREEFDSMLAETFPGKEILGTDEASSWLVKTFAGFSPFAAKEIVFRADAYADRIGDEFEQFIHDISAGEFSPVLISNDAGNTIGFYAFPTVQHPESNQYERSSISTAADVYYTTELPKEALSQAKDVFLGKLRKELESRERTLAFIDDSIAECEGADQHKIMGELLLSQLASVSEEASSVELVNYYDPDGRTVNIKLDPQLTPAENAEAYFRKYQKAVSGAEALQDRLTETNREIKVLKVILEEANKITEVEAVKDLTDELESQGIRFQKQEESVTVKKKAEFDGHRITRFQYGNFEVFMGMNSLANDYLLVRVAKPNDIWLHVKASPSAHVIIRTNGKPDSVPRSVIEAAAELTAKNSDSKHSSLVPVDYTLRKHVRKPKGAPAGKAIYVNEKTLYITPNLKG